jgi:hypothetical protein
VEGSCEHGNEPSGFIKRWEFLERVPQLAASHEGLSPVELVIFYLQIKLMTPGTVKCAAPMANELNGFGQ